MFFHKGAIGFFTFTPQGCGNFGDTIGIFFVYLRIFRGYLGDIWEIWGLRGHLGGTFSGDMGKI